MNSVPWSSVRVRLTLWNAALLALLLVGSSTALCFQVQMALRRSVDEELAKKAQLPSNWPAFLEWVRESHWAPTIPAQPPPAWPVPPAASAADNHPDWSRPRFLTPAGQPAVPFGPFVNDQAWDPRTLVRSAAGERVYSTVEVGYPRSGSRVRLRVYSRPVRREGEVELVIQLAHPLGDLDEVNRKQVSSLLILLPLALLVAGVFGSWMTERTLRPVRRITEAAAQIGAEDLSQRLEVASQDEFGELAETFNRMIHRLEQAFRRLETAFEQQRRFTADASHELRTPLTMITAGASLALKAPRTPEQYRKVLHVIKQAAEVMNRLVRDLLLLARADAEQLWLEPLPLAVETLFDCALAALPEGATPAVCFDPPEPALGVMGDLDSLVRLLGNLIENAIRHTPATGEIAVSAREAGGEVMISVTDTGEGIPAEHLARVCERFYRVDAARGREEGGAGLGLAICRSIAQAHHGRLEIDSQVGHGTTVRITLPRGPVLGADPDGRSAPPSVPTPSGTPTARGRGG
jgi:heavy metal sensor kinase